MVTNIVADLDLWVKALALTQPRILAMLFVLPIFHQSVFPIAFRLAFASALGLLIVPQLLPIVEGEMPAGLALFGIVIKEAFLGFLLGFLVAAIFWMVEAVGFFIDNQRGASISSTLSPLTGNDSSPLGELFNQAFIVYFFISGGFSHFLLMLYDSFLVWDIFRWYPTFRGAAINSWLGQLDNIMRLVLLLGAPVIVAMFLAEVGLALVSRFVPNLQVFFLAMPIKSGVALLVLVVYVQTMFSYISDHVIGITRIVSFLSELLR